MTWLDRQSFLGGDSDAVLSAMRVGIIGLGGGGSHVVQQLAHIGIGGFVIVDDDVISESNLNRLVGATRADVLAGRRKVDIARRVIEGVNPAADIEALPTRWQEVAERLRDCDAIFGCVDSVRAKDELEAFCRRLLIPYIDQGMDVHETGAGFLIAGQILLSMPGQPCLRCYGIVDDAVLEEEARNYGAAGGKPQVVWPNGVLASTAIALFLQLITPWHNKPTEGICLEYDGNNHTVQPSDRAGYLRNRTCPHHDAFSLGDLSFDIRGILRRAPTAPADAPRQRWLSHLLSVVIGYLRRQPPS